MSGRSSTTPASPRPVQAAHLRQAHASHLVLYWLGSRWGPSWGALSCSPRAPSADVSHAPLLSATATSLAQ